MEEPKMEPINKNPNFRYCEDKVIGSGRFAYVFAGEFNQKVAVKRIQLIDVKKELGSRELILKELQHPHIVKFLYYEEDKNFRFIAFELCDENLREYVEQGPVITDELAKIKIILQLTNALKYIHSQNIIHRDIKPENVLVSKKNLPVIMKWADFGSSKPTNDRGSASMSGARGTKAWLAPEIILYFNGKRDSETRYSRKSDIFSAGCVFFFFLTNGIHPYGADGDEGEIQKNILDENMKNKNELNDGHPAQLTVNKMMENRLGLDEVIEELENVLQKISDANMEN